MEIDWSRMDGKKGALILADDGIYFQPYNMSEKAPYLLGNAVSIGKTGVFGAANMYKKLTSDSAPSIPEIAKKLRVEKGLDGLVKKNMAIYFPWGQIKDIKKKIFAGTVVVLTKKGNKIVVSDPDNQKAVFNFISDYI